MAEEKKVTLTGPQLEQLIMQEERKLNTINERVSTLQRFRSELMAARDSVSEISQAEKGEKILVNLGAGVFVHATLDSTEKAVASIAGDVFTEKNAKELAKTLEKKIAGIEKQMDSIGAQQQKALMRLNQLNQVLEAGRRYMTTQKQKAQ